MISVQTDDFDIAALYQQITAKDNNPLGYGAIVTFVGKVRDFNLEQSVSNLTLEHYPGMTEKALAKISEQAQARWPIATPLIVHRVGELTPGDQIVYIGVASAHRKTAFEACEFIIDYLKTQAPFWKKESDGKTETWLNERESDHHAAAKWKKNSGQ
ncbi:molybdopterin synthase catalytic subunit MoaE [Psychrobium sp. MM17-31]|uniref:molybdopterin synthase catalytic subunit MoaE n=1 Tax=Psychrobium sp. MM17-31 TaxID=2917758 RepID=UPI001EF59DEF|nr:molybdopterin synthase catalytic subunit MoaE [Psychrobium sp. MM17-31]